MIPLQEHEIGWRHALLRAIDFVAHLLHDNSNMHEGFVEVMGDIIMMVSQYETAI